MLTFLVIIVLLCTIILIGAVNPNVSKILSVVFNKKQKTQDISVSDTSDAAEIRIEQLLEQIEKRKIEEQAVEKYTIDLGLLDENVITNLDDYYARIVTAIKDNYNKNTEVDFILRIDETIFEDWYTANYQSGEPVGGTTYDYLVDYSKNEGFYEISHKVVFH